MKEMKSFLREQILLIENSVNDKLGNNAQLQEKSNEKYIIEEIHHLREENKTKKCIIQTLMENQNNLLNRIKSTDGNHSEMFLRNMHKATILSPLDIILKIVMLIKVLRLRQETSSSPWKM